MDGPAEAPGAPGETFGSGLSSGGDFVYFADAAGNVLAVELMASFDGAAYSQSFDGPGEINGAAIIGCYTTPTPGAANVECAPTGCGDPLAGNYNPDAVNIDNTLCVFEGACTDPLADNYDETALLDDGSCQYTVRIIVDMAQQGSNGASISLDGAAAVTMAYANFDAYSFDYTVGEGDFTASFVAADGTAETVAPRTISIASPLSTDTYVFCFDGDTNCTGCTDASYTEYNAYAVGDDGSCVTAPVLGCTYPDAENYSPTATVDDGSCSGFGGSDCPADLNGDGQIGAGDLLEFLGVFGSFCD